MRGVLPRVSSIAAAFALLTGMAAAASPNIRISRIYGAGGNGGAPLNADYVELVNASTSSVSIDGWTLQYASAGGTSFGASNSVPLSGIIPPGGYFLVGLSAGANGAALPDPDLNFPGPNAPTLSLSGTAGRVALVNSTASLGTTLGPTGPTIVDFVGYGTSAATYEGSAPAPAPSTTNAIIRLGDGATDTDQNGADFAVIAAGANPPRNSQSDPLNVGPDITAPGISSLVPANGATAVALDANLVINFNESVAPAGGTVRLYKSSSPSTPIQSFTVAAGNISGGVATFDPTNDFEGGVAYHVLVDANAFTDTATSPNAFPGISDPAVWSFTTAEPPAPGPVPETLTPSNGAIDVPLSTAFIEVTYDRNILQGSGNILIKNATTNATVQTINIANLGFLENWPTLTIDISPLAAGVSYYVEIPAGAVLDAADNDPSAAFGSALTWSFTMIAADVTAPTVASLTPAASSTNASPVGQMRVLFDEPVQISSGNILIKRASDNTTVETIAINSSAVALEEVFVNVGTPPVPTSLGLRQLAISRSVPLALSTGYYVEITPGAIEDASGNDFAGLSGPTAWPFTTATVPVVINKFSNSSPDVVELLVVGNEVPGTTVDMRGMVIKDFGSDMNGDGGGKYVFADNPIWQTVPVGTLVVLSASAVSEDISPVNDFVMKVGLDSAYFTLAGGTFNIAATEMVMIKAKDVTDPPLTNLEHATGLANGFHVMGAGPAGSQFINFGGPKLRAEGQSATNRVAYANNSTSSLFDFFGSDATGNVNPIEASPQIVFGTPNNQANAAYIATLRGVDATQGNGTATLVNATVGSPFLGTGIFDRGMTGQTASLTLSASSPSVTLSNLVFTVPAELTTTVNSGTVSISGTGATGASLSFSGQTITVSSAAVTSVDSLTVSISGISTPTPSLVTDTGNYPIAVSTSGGSALPVPIAVSPAVRVIIPISAIRDINGGVPVDVGAVVAVQGIVTHANFSTAGINGSIQDETGGMILYSSSLANPLVRGHRFAALGTVATFRGLTEVVISNTANLVDLGAAPEVTPVTLTVAQLNADPEAYESMLIKVDNLYAPGGVPPGWGVSSNTTLEDGAGNDIVIRIQQGSTAITPPAVYPVNIVGVLGQYSESLSAPFSNTGYQLQPRDPADVTEGTAPTGFGGWLATNDPSGAISDDHDNDGVPNGVEYFFGLTGDAFTANPGLVNGKITWPTANVSDLVYAVQTSTTLAADSWEDVPASSLDLTVPGSISYTPPASTPGQPKLFIRFLVETPTPP